MWKHTQTLIKEGRETDTLAHTNINQKWGNTQTLSQKVETHRNINKKGREIETLTKQLETNTNINRKRGNPQKH